MKRKSVLAVLVAGMMMAAASPVCADGVASMPEEVVSAVEETESPYVGASPVCGRWYGVSYAGDYNYVVTGEYYILPDLTLYDESSGVSYDLEATEEEGVYKLAIPEELSDKVSEIRLEYGILDEPLSDESPMLQHLHNEAGSEYYQLIVSALSKDNPLAGNTDTVSTFLRYKNETDVLSMLMKGKVWKIGENKLSIDPEHGDLNLNDGLATGQSTYSFDDEHGMTVSFRWNGGSSKNSYEPVAFTADTITLRNLDDPSDEMELVYDGEYEAPAAEAADSAEAPAEF